MTPEDLAERHAYDRDGFDVVDYGEIGLPYWRMRVRCDALAPKAISAFEEALLRGLELGIKDPADLGLMLGLDDRLLDAAMATLIGENWIEATAGGRYLLTSRGTDVLAAAAEIVPVERVVPLDYDGLLRETTIVDDVLTPKQLAAAGIREVPPHPARKPDLPELRTQSAAIQRLLRAAAHGRDQETHLLGIKQVDRRDRMFRRGLALVYRARTGGRVQVAILVDDEPSPRHEEAIARAQLVERLGLDRALQRRKPSAAPAEVPDEIAQRLDLAAEAQARSRIHAVQARDDIETDNDARKHAEQELNDARAELRKLPVRTVPTYEHPRLMDLALRSSQHRLLLVSPWVKDAIVDQAFLRLLRGRLQAGTDVHIGYGYSDDPAADIDRRARDGLRTMAADYPNLRFSHLGGGTHAKVLISDTAFLVITSFNWMSFRGDPTRTFRDERGVVISTQSEIDHEWNQWMTKWPNPSPPRADRRGPRPMPQHARRARTRTRRPST
jgi:hypothetical protein